MRIIFFNKMVYIDIFKIPFKIPPNIMYLELKNNNFCRFTNLKY